MIDYDILFEDPAQAAAVDMTMFGFTIKSGGYDLFARCYKPELGSPEEKRPVLVMMHGFPGNEQFPDLAHALRRAGFVCITYTARGAWGSYGPYRFDTLLDDALAVLEHVKQNADALSVDVDNIFYFGHSVGGLTTTRFLASAPDVIGAVIVAPCDMPEVHDNHREVFDALAANAAPLLRFNEGEDISVLYDELAAKGADWKFPLLGKRVSPKYKVLLIAGEQDTTCPIPIHVDPLRKAFDEAGVNYEYVALETDHNIQSKRIEFTRIVYKWLSAHQRSLIHQSR